MARIFVATSPFGRTGTEPLDRLTRSGHEIVLNPLGRRLRAGEVESYLADVDAVIAGTEPYNRETLSRADRLKVIARVGIGLDSVDLEVCREKKIQVTYTPDGPTQAVAELTVANLLNLIRHIHESDRSVREKAWNRLMGSLVSDITVGIVGVGRIGRTVIRLLEPFMPHILACDTDPAVHGTELPGVEWTDADNLLAQSDAVSLHIPLTTANHHYMDRSRIARMKTGAVLINTSRGAIVDTSAVQDALLQQHLGGAALDVFEEEPYEGLLTRVDNTLLTAHIAASARGSRFKMEQGAVLDCLRVLSGASPQFNALNEGSS